MDRGQACLNVRKVLQSTKPHSCSTCKESSFYMQVNMFHLMARIRYVFVFVTKKIHTAVHYNDYCSIVFRATLYLCFMTHVMMVSTTHKPKDELGDRGARAIGKHQLRRSGTVFIVY